MSTRSRPGFMLTELMPAVTVAALVLLVLGFQLSRRRVDADESAAITALRSIASAQAQLASSAAIDSNGNGVGEYGYLGELAGSAPLRVYDPVADAPALDGNNLTLAPPLLPSAFTSLDLLLGEAEVERGGYRFKMYLPSFTSADHDIRGLPETGPAEVGGATAGFFPDADNSEVYWACYAWPDQPEGVGQRAFFVNQEGRLLQTANGFRARETRLPYYGPAGGPAYDAALSPQPGRPDGATGMGALLGTAPRKALDGNTWNVFRP